MLLNGEKENTRFMWKTLEQGEKTMTDSHFLLFSHNESYKINNTKKEIN